MVQMLYYKTKAVNFGLPAFMPHKKCSWDIPNNLVTPLSYTSGKSSVHLSLIQAKFNWNAVGRSEL